MFYDISHRRCLESRVDRAPAAVTGTGQQGDLEAGQVLHIIGQLAADRESHDDPGDGNRRLDRHHHDLERLVIDDGDGIGAIAGLGLVEHAEHQGFQLVGLGNVGAHPDFALTTDQHRQRCAGAPAETGQGRGDGRAVDAVVGADDLHEGGVARLALGQVADLLTILLKQVAEYLLAIDEFTSDRGTDVAFDTLMDHIEADDLYKKN